MRFVFATGTSRTRSPRQQQWAIINNTKKSVRCLACVLSRSTGRDKVIKKNIRTYDIMYECVRQWIIYTANRKNSPTTRRRSVVHSVTGARIDSHVWAEPVLLWRVPLHSAVYGLSDSVHRSPIRTRTRYYFNNQ